MTESDNINNFGISYVNLITKIDDKGDHFKSLTFNSARPIYDKVYEKEIRKGLKEDGSKFSEEELKDIIKNTSLEDKLKPILGIFDKVVESGCSILAFSENHSNSCLPTYALEDMVKNIDYNYLKILKDKDLSTDEYRKLLSMKLKDFYHLKDDKDIKYKMEKNKIQASDKTKEAVDMYIKPIGPIGKEWLSNVEIEQLLKQNEILTNRGKTKHLYKFGGVYPIDFYKWNDYEINDFINKELKGKFKPVDFDGPNVLKVNKNGIIKLYEYNGNYDYIGLVLNHDRRNMGGSHWVAVFIDIPKTTIYYYDSIGEVPRNHHYKFFDILEDKTTIPFKLRYNEVKRQTSGGDCGVYACCFIIIMSNAKDTKKEFDNFLKLILKPNFVNSLRKIFFIDDSKI